MLNTHISKVIDQLDPYNYEFPADFNFETTDLLIFNKYRPQKLIDQIYDLHKKNLQAQYPYSYIKINATIFPIRTKMIVLKELLKKFTVYYSHSSLATTHKINGDEYISKIKQATENDQGKNIYDKWIIVLARDFDPIIDLQTKFRI